VPIFSPTQATPATTSSTSVTHRVSARTRRSLVGLLSLVLIAATLAAVSSALTAGPTHAENALPLPPDAARQVTVTNEASWCWSSGHCALAAIMSPGATPSLEFTTGERVVLSDAHLPTFRGHQVTVTGLWCSTINDCWAAGTIQIANSSFAVVSRLHGDHWTTTDFVLPADAEGGPSSNQEVNGDFGVPVMASLSSLSCTSDSSCVAVGSYQDTRLNVEGLVATFDGSTWLAQRSPLPSNATYGPTATADGQSYWQSASLSGVSCGNGTHCAIIGSYTSNTLPSTVDSIPLIIDDANSSLTALEAPLPYRGAVNDNVMLSSVSCASGDSCTVVGRTNQADPGHLYSNDLFGIVQDRSGWRAHSMSGASASLSQALAEVTVGSSPVTCWAPEQCAMTIGYGSPTYVVFTGFVATSLHRVPVWSGGSVPVASGAIAKRESQIPSLNAYDSFTNIQCSGPETCDAFAVSDDGSESGRPTFFHEVTSTWSLSSMPVAHVKVDPWISQLNGMACQSFGCVAVGSYETRFGNVPLVSNFQNGRWTSDSVTLPNDASSGHDAVLNGVWCAANADCVAVGSYMTRLGWVRPLAEVRNGGVWSPTSPVMQREVNGKVAANASSFSDASSAGIQLATVGCTSLTQCWAGGFNEGDNNWTPLFHLDGSTWTPIDVVLPNGDALGGGTYVSDKYPFYFPNVSSIDCDEHDESCTVVGNYPVALGNRIWEAALVTNDRLRATDLFAQSGKASADGLTSSVACSESRCVVTATLALKGQVLGPALFVHNGHAWHFHMVRGMSGDGLGGIDCHSTRSCEVTGGPWPFVTRLTFPSSNPTVSTPTYLPYYDVVSPSTAFYYGFPPTSISCSTADYCAIGYTSDGRALVNVVPAQ